MKISRRVFTKLLGLSGLGVGASGTVFAQNKLNDVVIKPRSGRKQSVKNLIKKNNGKVKKEFNNFDYISINVPDQALQGLQNNPNIENIEADIKLSLIRGPPNGVKDKSDIPGLSKNNTSKRDKNNKSKNITERRDSSENNTRSSNENKDKNKNKTREDLKRNEDNLQENPNNETNKTNDTDEENVNLEDQANTTDEASGNISSWSIERIGAYDTDELGNGSSVAVLDTGIDNTHDDLSVVNQVDYTGEGIGDNNGHGTHIGGVIGSYGDLIGVSPETNLYDVKVMDSSGEGSLTDILSGIDWVIDNNINVVNLSLGTTTDSDILHDAVDEARNKGHLVVAAAGNEGNKQDKDCSESNVLYPAKYNSTISVSAMSKSENIAEYSSVGSSVNIMAPGSDVKSTYLNNKYAYMSGTSMASPHVAGVSALLFSSGYSNPDNVQNKIEESTEVVLDTCEEGEGLINAKKSLSNNTEEDNTEEDNTEEDNTEEDNTEEDNTDEDNKNSSDRDPREGNKSRGEQNKSENNKSFELPEQASSQANKKTRSVGDRLNDIFSSIFG